LEAHRCSDISSPLRHLLAAGVIAGGLAGPVAASDTATRAAQAGDEHGALALTIHIKNFRYDPASTTVHIGDRVAFVNDDDEAHTVTANDTSFDSAGLDAGATWRHRFMKAGTFAYFCELHPYMKATIIVLPRQAARDRSGAR
jgi:plastocyanin